ncbi:hypothetical protein Tco_1373305, partial [Tanacetum coccineum]
VIEQKCMTRTSNQELVEPYEEPERVLYSLRKLFKTTSLASSSSLEFKLFSDHENQSEEEIMGKPTIEEYMTKTRDDYGSGITRSKIDEKARDLEIVDLFLVPDVTQDQLMLRVLPMSLTGAESRWIRNEPAGLDVPTRQILDSKGAIPTMNAANAKTRSIDTFDGLAAIQAQLNNLGREIMKVNEIVYAAQVGYESCNGSHYIKDFPLKEESKTLEEAYYTQFRVPFPQGRRYRVAGPGFYQRDNGNPSYQERRHMMEE